MFTNNSLRGRDRDAQTLARELIGLAKRVDPSFGPSLKKTIEEGPGGATGVALRAYLLELGAIGIAEDLLTAIEQDRMS